MNEKDKSVKSSDNKQLTVSMNKARARIVLENIQFVGSIVLLIFLIDFLTGKSFFFDYYWQIMIVGFSITAVLSIWRIITFTEDKYVKYVARVEEWKKRENVTNVKDFKEWKKKKKKAAKTKEWNRQLVSIESMGWAGFITIMIAAVVYLGIRLVDKFSAWEASGPFGPFQSEAKFLIIGIMAIIYLVHKIFFNKKRKENQKSVE